MWRLNTPMREQRKARERDRMQRFLHQVTTAAAELAGDRGWERILLSGEKRWIEPTTARFPQPLRDNVFADTRILNGLNDVALAAAVTEWAHEQHNERERQLWDS